MDAAINIEPYRVGWAELFASERALLANVLRPWLVGPIEHIGSTAVPGLDAKPIIDIIAGVRDLETSRVALSHLAEVGYCYAPYRADVMHWLCKPSPVVRAHHLHLVPFASELWRDRITFRDRLRSDRKLAAEYASLKHHLARSYVNDRESYTENKGPFIEKVLRGAAEHGVQPEPAHAPRLSRLPVDGRRLT